MKGELSVLIPKNKNMIAQKTHHHHNHNRKEDSPLKVNKQRISIFQK
jgi:hypothetical protein